MNSKSLYWVDKARVWASIAVVVIHVNSIFINVYSKEVPGFWTISNVTGSIVRWAVPLFVMLSGFLLLSSRPEPFEIFLNKKFKRILYPLFGWTVLYYFYIYMRSRYLNGSPLVFSDVINDFLLAKPYFHLYFLFLILGLYLITPFLKLFLQHAEIKITRYLIIFSLTISALPVALDYFLPENCFFVKVIGNDSMFNYFIQYLGYFLTGYYIVKYVALNSKNTLVAWILFLVSVFITILGSYIQHNTGYFYSYLSLNVIFMSVSIFYLFLYYRKPISLHSEKIVRFIAPNTLGIYLIHPIIFELFPSLHKISFLLGPILGTLVIATLVYLISMLLIVIARKVPFVKQIV